MQSESQVILNSPCISIVMATYNGERYLTQQIESHLAQNYPNLEFIYVDDASTDATWEILQSFQKNDSRIKIFQNETNLGYIKTFEKGIQLASSDLIALSDQDDVWMADKITQLYESLGSFSLVYSDSELIDENEKLLGRKMSEIKKQIAYSSPLMYTFGAWAPGHSMLFNRNIIPTNFKFPTYVTHDYCLGFLATCQGGIQYIPKSLVHYRQHTNNVIGANTKSNKSKKNRAQKRNAIQQRISFRSKLSRRA